MATSVRPHPPAAVVRDAGAEGSNPLTFISKINELVKSEDQHDGD
jgi:hypothetical protein